MRCVQRVCLLPSTRKSEIRYDARLSNAMRASISIGLACSGATPIAIVSATRPSILAVDFRLLGLRLPASSRAITVWLTHRNLLEIPQCRAPAPNQVDLEAIDRLWEGQLIHGSAADVQHRQQGVRLAHNLNFPTISPFIHNAAARVLDRYVQSSKCPCCASPSDA